MTMNHPHTPHASFSTMPLYLSAPDAVALVRRKGLKNCIAGMAEYIRADFLRWPDFDKSARVANHSQGGVIELMPIADDTTYSFKYVNGHPKNTAEGLLTVTAFGVLADVDTGSNTLVLTADGVTHHLSAGDCLRYQLNGASRFVTPAGYPARYFLFMV